MNVRLFVPNIGDDELEAVKGAFDRRWIGLGSEVERFEREFEEYLGTGHCLAVNSGTAALHLALLSLNIEKGKKVMVNNLTFVASAMAILYNDLEPVLVDCESDTLGFNLEDAKNKYSPDVAAIVLVHYAGDARNVKAIVDWAKERGIYIIEDCAHCVGGSFEGKKLGTLGDIGCFSFEEKKGMTTGDGGMLVFKDEEIMAQIKPSRWIGIDKDTWKRQKNLSNEEGGRHWYYEVAQIGFKYNMNDLAASIGLVQLKKLDNMNRRKREIVARYLESLGSIKGLRFLLPYEEGTDYWIFGLRCSSRESLIEHLKKKSIASGVHYMPISLHPLFQEYADGTCTVSESVWEDFLSLPFHSSLSDSEVDYVCESISEYFDLKGGL